MMIGFAHIDDPAAASAAKRAIAPSDGCSGPSPGRTTLSDPTRARAAACPSLSPAAPAPAAPAGTTLSSATYVSTADPTPLASTSER